MKSGSCHRIAVQPGYPLLLEWVLPPSSPTERRVSSLQPRRLACTRLGSVGRPARRLPLRCKGSNRRRSPADPAVRPALHLGAHAVSPAKTLTLNFLDVLLFSLSPGGRGEGEGAIRYADSAIMLEKLL